MRVLVFDPSGNFGDKEGSGTTGWAFFKDGELKDFGAIKSEGFDCQERYWKEHWYLVTEYLDPEYQINSGTLLMESYRLFANKAQQQSWSTMDTPQLIGYLRMKCWEHGTQVLFQDPSDKVRVADPILVKMGVFELKGKKHYCMGRSTVIHERDAIRHGIFWHRYGKGKELLK